MTKVVVIEDEEYAYQAIEKKLQQYPDLELVREVELITDSTSVIPFVDTISDDGNIADIYFVDWELKFKVGTKSIEHIFKLLSQRKFSFLDKFWICISNKPGNKIPELLSEYFPLNYNYVTPGKGNIIEQSTKSGKNHFQECIFKAREFLALQNKPDWINDIDFKTLITFDNYNGHYYDLRYIVNAENEGNAFTVTVEAAICFISFDPFGLLLFMDKEKGLHVYLFKMNDAAKAIKEPLQLEGKRIFFYNPYFIENGHLKEKFKDYITHHIKFIKGLSIPDIEPKIIQCFDKIRRELESRKILI
ncbi:MAG: hypothetical protein F9K23_18735 [Bacteroidetes bacterium]|nr:MAG: hypothetical protein F9K23_18735 [Bacteroidota bacterium]